MTLNDTSPLTHRRIVNAIRGEMVSAGLAEVDSDPDLYVTYYGDVDKSTVIMTTGWAYNYPTDWRTGPHPSAWHKGGSTRDFRRGSTTMHHATTSALTVREGTLMIDIWDARIKELVWRAEISDTLSENPEQNSATIMNGISKVFENFPPASASASSTSGY